MKREISFLKLTTLATFLEYGQSLVVVHIIYRKNDNFQHPSSI